MKNSLFLLLLIGTIRSVTLSEKKVTDQEPRKLNETEMLQERMLENDHKISIEKVRVQVKNLHANVKICLDQHFEKDPKDMLPFHEIQTDCTGDNYSVILRFYNSINFEVKEITKERIKNKLTDGFCNDVLFECITYFKTMELFIDKDFDLLKSFEFNKKELERKIEPQNLTYLLELTQKELGDYDTIREDLINERKFLTDYFKEKMEDYEAKFGSPAN
jgi:hypothetical protein